MQQCGSKPTHFTSTQIFTETVISFLIKIMLQKQMLQPIEISPQQVNRSVHVDFFGAFAEINWTSLEIRPHTCTEISICQVKWLKLEIRKMFLSVLFPSYFLSDMMFFFHFRVWQVETIWSYFPDHFKHITFCPDLLELEISSTRHSEKKKRNIRWLE